MMMLEREIHEKVKTGTTTVGLVCNNAVILAAERKATMGYLVASKDAKKILQIDEHMAMTIAGVVGDAQALERYIKAELRLYALQEERRISVKAASTLIGNILYSRRFYPYIVQLVVAGYDTSPRLFTLSPDGSVLEEKFFSTGSGSPIALGVLENEFKEGMELEAAKRIAARAVRAATKRDIASGGSGIDLMVLDSKGVHKVPEEEVKKLTGS
jgi:proteasome beta subunit